MITGSSLSTTDSCKHVSGIGGFVPRHALNVSMPGWYVPRFSLGRSAAGDGRSHCGQVYSPGLRLVVSLSDSVC